MWLILTAVAVASLSLLIPSTPSYDPWSWLVWGREIVHTDLHTTGGPSWKPLPVIFTTVFAIFGKAQPDLWLIVARAGAIVAVAMAARLAWRMTTRLTGGLSVWPAASAALLAAAALTFSGGFITNNALGYSEGLMTALVLLAVDFHLDGDYRGAFVLGFGVALDRPETWAFWGPYGLWLLWRDPGSRALVLTLFAAIPVLWFLPEMWGSGHLFRGVSRAQHVRSNSAANASCPFCSELVHHAWIQVIRRVKFVVIPALALALALVWRSYRRRSPMPSGELLMVLLAGLGGAWWVLISVMTQAGFSGNDRYLVVGTALVVIAGAAGWAWFGHGLGLVARRLIPSVPAPATAAAGALATTALFFAIPPWIATDVPAIHRALVYQAHLRSGAAAAVKKLGGSAAVLRCGIVMTEGFQVPMLAWTLDVHTARVWAEPGVGAPLGPAPNVIFQTRAQRHASLLPSDKQIAAWTKAGAHYRLVARTAAFAVYSTCPL